MLDGPHRLRLILNLVVGNVPGSFKRSMIDKKVTFIVPLKNEERTIRQCIDSIINQMVDGDQVIVVDNGSTDRSPEIVEEYKSILFLENGDVSIGCLRNIGAKSAQGDVLGFIDADCVLRQGWRNEVFRSFENPKIVATGSKYILPEKPHWIERVWFSQKKEFPGSVAYINSGNLAVRKDDFDRVGGFDENLITGEDAELCGRLRANECLVWENPKIEAVHLGNPKDLWNFYKKQRWHALGMFGTFKVSWFDKPVIMTFGYVLSWLVVLLFALRSALFDGEFPFVLAVLILLGVPAITAVFRCAQFGKFNYFLHYLWLYSIYYAARSEALFRIIYNKLF